MKVTSISIKGKVTLIAIGVLALLSTFAIWIASTDAFTTPLTPDETITAYYDHAKNGNIDEAKKYISEEVIEVYENGGTWFTASLKSAIIKEGKEYTEVEPVKDSVEINNQTASVTVRVYNENGLENLKLYHLVREKGEWKITFN